MKQAHNKKKQKKNTKYNPIKHTNTQRDNTTHKNKQYINY